MLRRLGLLLLVPLLLAGCRQPAGKPADNDLRGDLIVFHAGSLSIPIHQIADSFEAAFPGTRVLLEAAGSKACARKITDLGKPCDVFASADYKVIENMLIPAHASWCIRFAGNEMAIVYTDKSKYSNIIDNTNWPGILLRDDVTYGRSDPDSDPCGVRALFTLQLSEQHYGIGGLTGRMMKKDREMIRPKETDLIALLETGTLDYLFLYRSVAVQHGFRYLALPDSVNLRSASLAAYYKNASVTLRGMSPGETLIETGEPMVYGITIPHHPPKPLLAVAFTRFFLDEGMQIMERQGQPSVIPSPAIGYDKIPSELRSFAIRN